MSIVRPRLKTMSPYGKFRNIVRLYAQCPFLFFLVQIGALVMHKWTVKAASPSLENTLFKIVVDENDPHGMSQDFVVVKQGAATLGERILLSCAPLCSTSGPVSLEMDICAKTEILSNVVIFTRSDEEFNAVLGKLTQYVSKLLFGTHPRSRIPCRFFIFTTSCNNTLSAYHLENVLHSKANYRRTGQTNLLPFNWNSDLFIVQHCQETKSVVKIWEAFSAKTATFTKLLGEQQQPSRESQGKTVGPPVIVNLTDFWWGMVNKSKVARRQDLEGLDITAAGFFNQEDEDDNPYEIKLGKGASGKDIFVSGMSVRIFQDFKDALNFTENVLKIYFNLENYFETSFLSEEYQFDINLYHLGVTENRTNVAQPLHPTFFDGVHVMFIQPTDRSVRDIYRKPFAFQMWSVLFYTWTVIFLSCKLTTYLHSKMDTLHLFGGKIDQEERYDMMKVEIDSDSEDETPNDHVGFEAWLWCIGTICQQGWHTFPNSTSVRLIITTGLFLSFICYSAYTGKIVSELWNVPKPIKSLKQLLSYVDHVYLISSSDTSYDILEGLDKTLPEVLKKIRFRTVEVVYRKLIDLPGKACTIGWTDTIHDIVREKKIQEHGGHFPGIDAYICETFHSFSFQSYSSLYIPKYSELEHLFNYRIIVGLERGFIRRYWNNYNRDTKLFCLQLNPQVTTLDFGHVFFAFFLLWSGMGLCVLLLVVEYFAYQWGCALRCTSF